MLRRIIPAIFIFLVATSARAQTPAGCIDTSATSGWWTQPMTPPVSGTGGSFVAQVIPGSTGNDVVVGWSQGVSTTYANLAAIIRFATTGTIQAFNGNTSTSNPGGLYVDASPPIPYVVPAAGHFYVVQVKVDALAAGTYSAYVTPPGGTQQLIASGLKFRTTALGMPTITTLDTAGGATGVATARLCNIQTINPLPPSSITVNGSAPFSAQGNVTYTQTPNLTGCSAVINVMNIAVTCPQITGSVPWFTSGSAPYSVTLGFDSTLPPGCVPSIIPSTIQGQAGTITFQNCAPFAPAIACTIATSTHSVTLSWSASTSSGVTGYNVYRGTVNNGPYAVLAANVQGIQYIDTSIVAGTTYYYVVTALNPQGESIYSNQATAVIPVTGTGTVKATIPPSHTTARPVNPPKGLSSRKP